MSTKQSPAKKVLVITLLALTMSVVLTACSSGTLRHQRGFYSDEELATIRPERTAFALTQQATYSATATAVEARRSEACEKHYISYLAGNNSYEIIRGLVDNCDERFIAVAGITSLNSDDRGN